MGEDLGRLVGTRSGVATMSLLPTCLCHYNYKVRGHGVLLKQQVADGNLEGTATKIASKLNRSM